MKFQEIKQQEIVKEKSTEIQRYVFIDFLRGVAIFSMVLLHTLMLVLDIDSYIARISDVGFINLFAMLFLPIMSGLAGLFLITSAMGNMQAMIRNLKKGYSENTVIKKQVVGGFILLFFAMLVESTIGYHAAIGEFFKHLDNPSIGNYSMALNRGYLFEAIHAIAWCMIINGIVQGLLAKKYDINHEVGKFIKTYWILALVVLALTPIIWALTSYLVPGYPFATDPATGAQLFRPHIGITPWYNFIIMFFFNPLAAPMQPIFPYLATSFVGSAIGLQVARKPSEIQTGFIKKYFKFGFALFIIGYIGVIVNVVAVIDASGIDRGLGIYKDISNHRGYVPERGVPYAGWLWQYLTLSGITLMVVTFALRVIEFRGASKGFAEKTTFIRRFGFIAFTVYTIQYIIYVFQLPVSWLFGYETYNRLPWLGSFIVMFLTIWTYDFLMRRWEKKGYVGSLEWMMSTIANKLLAIKRQATYSEQSSRKWWEVGKLNTDDIFYNPNWLTFDVNESTRLQDELKLIRYCNIVGFFLFPFAFVSYYLIGKVQRDFLAVNIRGKKIVNMAGIIFFLIWFPLSFFISLSTFGISL